MTITTSATNRIAKPDLTWWAEKIPTLDWVFAVSYAEGAPHEYVSDRTQGMSNDDFVRAARVIRTFGSPQKFYKWTRTYLVHDGWKYWDMEGDELATCNLINRGRIEHIYGAQNAPSTVSNITSPYDGLASFWDAEHSATKEEADGLIELINTLGDFTKRRVLDIGCGTGLPLDLKITEPVRYVGIDPSHAMLNELVRKHKTLAGVQPMRFADALEQRVLGATRFDLVLALGGSASYLTSDEIRAIANYAYGPFVLSFYADSELPPTGDLPADAAHVKAAFMTDSTNVLRLGRFDLVFGHADRDAARFS